jgi:hypothetical protein
MFHELAVREDVFGLFLADTIYKLNPGRVLMDVRSGGVRIRVGSLEIFCQSVIPGFDISGWGRRICLPVKGGGTEMRVIEGIRSEAWAVEYHFSVQGKNLVGQNGTHML